MLQWEIIPAPRWQHIILKMCQSQSQGIFGMFVFVKERFGKMHSWNVLISLNLPSYRLQKKIEKKKKKIGERNFHWAQMTDGSWAMQLMLNEEKSLNCSSGHCLVFMSLGVLLNPATFLRFIRVDSSIEITTQILSQVQVFNCKLKS